jgi:SulP family sulfate permease
VVTAITVWQDLAMGVIAGVIVSALVFAWNSSKHLRVTRTAETEGERFYRLEGLLYFGSVQDFAGQFDPRRDPASVVIDCLDARVCDLSGLEALNALAERYRKAGKALSVRHLSGDCRRMLERAGSLIDVRVAEDDPEYLVANLAGKTR